jgi:hypothetical protein
MCKNRRQRTNIDEDTARRTAKFDAAMMSFEANTRRAIASSILVCCRHIMHIIVAYNIMYYRMSREADMTLASHSKCLHNTGVLARWHMVMVMAWMWVVIKVGSGPREILSGRIEFLLENLTRWVEFLPILCDPPCYPW